MTALEVIFWTNVSIVGYAHGGYGMLLRLLPRRRNPQQEENFKIPSVSLIIAAYDEENVIAGKLDNTLGLDYPRENLEILVVADGSQDGTCAIVTRYAKHDVKLLYSPERRGKNHAVNRAVGVSQGEIIVLTDANAILNTQAIKKLVQHFAAPNVGMVAGSKRVISSHRTAAAQEGLYWRYESWLKTQESRFASVVGAAGELLAVRRSSYLPPPRHAIIEDFWLTMSLIRADWRIIYEPEAQATEYASPSMEAELVRKTRIAAGGWQAMFAFADLLHPRRGRIAFVLWSHRLARWMIVPALLPVLLIINTLLAKEPLYATLLAVQLTFYAFAWLGWLLEKRHALPGWLSLPCFFVASHWACLVGGWRFLQGNQSAVWQRAPRDGSIPQTTEAG
ncbi:MAG: glycosyltransferase family 2 protein [Candidatus Sericytochromatia bacterium]|nr:glycosyltransferase family 2 protein [Candidatus Sericytochromatia bacterium]